MDFKKLFRKDEKAVSPVIGVILMVAITVILAAAIGSSVFGMGPAKSAPQASLDIKTGDKFVSGSSPATIRIEHLGGDPIHFETIQGVQKTKLMASVSGKSSVKITEANNADNDGGLGVLEVGSVKTLKLENGTTSASYLSVTPGETVNIKIIDIETNQLICDKDVRF
ncbi:MAG TPA: type IV pilin [Methanosarcina sp.]|nr:type IV pilin [Methanosarcina sp.]